MPFLYLLLGGGWSGIAVPPDSMTVMAHATSLAVVLPAAVSALWGYQRSGSVPWRVVLPMAAMAALCAAVATRLAPALPDAALKSGFTLFLAAMSVRMLWDRSAKDAPAPPAERRAPLFLLAGGASVGTLSAFLGVGGGTVAIPFLLYGVRLDIRKIAAASLGVVAAAALAGTLGYGLARPTIPLPAATVGYIHLGAALTLIPGAVVGARIGVRLNRKLHADRLRQLFGVLLLLVAVRIGWGIITTL